MRFLDGAGIGSMFIGMLYLLTQCGEHGVRDPEAFFASHRHELEQIVESLAATGIKGVDNRDYSVVRKDAENEADRVIYEQTQAFLRQNGLFDLYVYRMIPGNPDSISSTEFYVRRYSGFAELTHYYLIHVPTGKDYKPDAPLTRCRVIAPPHWLYCAEPG